MSEVAPPRFVAFIGADYYPEGGAEDEHAAFADAESAIVWARSNATVKYTEHVTGTWAHVWDVLEDKIIWRLGHE